MRVFDFTNAIVREPGQNVIDGLREDRSVAPDFAGVRREHATYVAVLREAGLTVDVLPPLEAFPDSIFVEDPALVFREGAILLRPGAPTRLGEREEMRGALTRHFEQVLELDGDEYADGGDVMVTPDVIFIGMSARTNRVGAEALVKKLARLGRKAKTAETPKSILHFKTAASLLDEETVLATKTMAGSSIFDGFRTVVTPAGEEAAANALRVKDTVLVGARFPRTIDLLTEEGYAVKALPVTEIGKLDAGLSCMSLRW
ncbi:MAG TPA: arginine deiminase family protein [Rhizomicrobium sp.]|nr:arginine deiminase family protein [Rhizomicrobium sp.]